MITISPFDQYNRNELIALMREGKPIYDSVLGNICEFKCDKWSSMYYKREFILQGSKNNLASNIVRQLILQEKDYTAQKTKKLWHVFRLLNAIDE